MKITAYRTLIGIIALPLLLVVVTGLPALLAVFALRHLAVYDNHKYAELIDKYAEFD